jgi:uncharacterized protein (DUF2249 family)
MVEHKMNDSNSQTVRQTPVEITEKIVDIRAMECQDKFSTVFATFDNLNPGEAFVLVNQFDPKPLQMKIRTLRGDGFSWDYLEDRPGLCRIRIGKTQ